MEESPRSKNRKPDYVRNSARSRSSDGSVANSVVLPSRSYDSSKKVKEAEVDFYDSPTTLSRLILHQKFESAIRRLEKAPYEASTWVSAIRAPDYDDDQTMKTSITINSSVQFSFRQIPLHMVCGELARVKDSVFRGQVEQLIGKLVTVYPDAAKKRDHDDRLPLHEALWHHASPQIISILLMAYPEALDEKDIFDRTALQIIQNRRGGNNEHKEAIEKMILRGCSFWNLARKEMTLKMKHGRVPSAGASVSSQSALNDSQADADDYTLATRESMASGRSGSGNNKQFRYGAKIFNPHAKAKKTPIAWEQLEHRAQKLEFMLTEHNEENFKMAEEINRLKKIEAKYEQLTSSQVVARQVIQLEKENAELTKTVNDLKRILQRNDITEEEMTQYTKPLEIVVNKMSSAMSVTGSVNRSFRSNNSSQLSSHNSSHQEGDVKDPAKVPTNVSLSSSLSGKISAIQDESSQSGKSSRIKEDTPSAPSDAARDDNSTISGNSKESGEWSCSGSEASPIPDEVVPSYRQSPSSSTRKSPFGEVKSLGHINREFHSQSTSEAPISGERRSLDGATVLETPLASPTSDPTKLELVTDDSAAFLSPRTAGKLQKGDIRSRRFEQQIHSLRRGTDAFDPATLCTDSLEVIPEAAIMVPSKESAEVARLRKERENLQSLVKDLVRDLNKKRVKRQTQTKGDVGEVEIISGSRKESFDAYRSLLTKSPPKSPSTSQVPVVKPGAGTAMSDQLKDYQSSLQRDSDSTSQRSTSSASKVLNSL